MNKPNYLKYNPSQAHSIEQTCLRNGWNGCKATIVSMASCTTALLAKKIG